jgi:hypothetical protein
MSTDFAFTLPHQPGAGRRVLAAFGQAGVNIIGACAMGQGGSAMVHLAVDDPTPARQALEDVGVTVESEQEVLTTTLQDRPGEGGEILGRLADAGVNVEFMYLATNNRLILGVDNIEKARGAL